MNGKILGNGVISGNDGKRYHFEPSDIKNLDGRDISQLSGKEVDFVAQDDKASEIFITQSAGLNINTQNILQITSSSNLTMVKTFAFISIALLVLSNIIISVTISFHNFLFIASLAVFIWAAYLIKKMAHSNTIFISAVVTAICQILATIIFIGEYNTLAIIFLLIYLEFTRRYYNELALLTSQWLFKLNIYIRAAWALVYIFNWIIFDTQTAILNECNYFTGYTSIAVLTIAWIQTQKIAKKTNV